MNDPVLLYAASAALACVLLLGALEKLKDIAGFTAIVSAYRILPAGWSGAFAWLFVLSEALAGALLLAPARQAAGAQLALLVLAAATLALAFNLLRGHRDIDCGCGGPAASGPGRGTQRGGLSWWLVLRNALLALWAAPALIAAAGQSRGLLWADSAAVFGLAMAAVGLYFTANHLLASHLKLRNL
ncbi:MauE/DoxX family redox-associated membrane protein [Achromobacter xylosoxidans]|uniref:Methylamine utilization protein MauE n=1 Tax=Alcaligenes xylosoxydans xylosoxydans TaxID=85698 RepID=A0A424W8F4_ALCXX|nr:MauE/DoxX family redox-associated membrane protein [Achromobacter xylosoxidans]MBC9907718.1 methylamine utilization protein MauE [Achromobacter xylosoxidans]MBD0871569.1 methylamine utilization protein MauE [Achromobacter xylosoxidans]QNP84058.1 methylamine utilization protein MauE [Achromobacter xylosoxidans]RPJ89563.1 methylamine utilization protein MauE [Achromobacter xylosoxidans]